MDIFSETADRAEFVVESHSPDMDHSMWERSALTPAICRGVILLIELRSCPALPPPGTQILPSTDATLTSARGVRSGALSTRSLAIYWIGIERLWVD